MFYKLVVLSCVMLSIGCSSDKSAPEAVTPAAPKVEPAELAQAEPAAATAPTPEFSVEEWGLVSYKAGEARVRSGPSAAPHKQTPTPTPAKLPVIRRSDLVAKKPVIYLKPGALWSAQTPIEVAVRFQGTGRLREVWPTPDNGAQPEPRAEFTWSRVHIKDAPCVAGWAPAIDSAACTSLKDLSEGDECEGAQLESWVVQTTRCLDVNGTPAGALVYNGRPADTDAPLEQISPGVWKNTSAYALGALLIHHDDALYALDGLDAGAQWGVNDQSMPAKQVKDAQAWAREQLKAQGLGAQESEDFMRAWSTTLADQARWQVFGFMSAQAIEAVATLKVTPTPSKITRVMAMTVEPQITAKPRLAEKRAAPLALPRLQLGDIKVVGGLDKAIVQRVVRRHRNELRFCYEIALQKEPELKGSLDVNLLISSRGAVNVAEVSSSTLESSTLERCVTNKIRRWMFPSLREGVSAKILLPITFSR